VYDLPGPTGGAYSAPRPLTGFKGYEEEQRKGKRKTGERGHGRGRRQIKGGSGERGRRDKGREEKKVR